MTLTRTTKGAGIAEYGLLTGLVALIAIGAVLTLGQAINFNFRITELEVGVANAPHNDYFTNGDFETIEGLEARSYGFEAGQLDGWTSLNDLNFELHDSGYDGMYASEGDYWLDMAASPGNMDIEQEFDGLVYGLAYRLTMYAGDRTAALDNMAMAFWNGQLLGILQASEPDVMEEHSFYIQAGAGDGTDRLRLVEIGSEDNDGMSIDQIRLWGR